METNLSDAAEVIDELLGELDWQEPTCSSRLNREIGRRLAEQGQMPSILGCAFEKDVPVYVPAFTDSELALDVATHFLRRRAAPGGTESLEDFAGSVPPFNPFLDLLDYARRVLASPRIGIFTIGGGVPRNWAQQVGPFIDVTNMRVGSNLRVPRISYGVRICPEPVHWGGLSGCTYSEGVSWGKFLSPDEGGRFAEVYCDATIAWPILVRAAIEELEPEDRGD
jgi:deoxyhypusine synthase